MLAIVLAVALPAQAASQFSKLFTDSDSDDFLPVDQAFKVEAGLIDASHAQLKFVIAPGHYLYRERIQLLSPAGDAAKMALPAGETKNDPNFGEQQVFHHDTLAEVAFSGTAPTTLQVRYQGCSEKGLCYPPQTKLLTLGASASTSSGNSQAITSSMTSDQTEDEISGRLLSSGRWW
jgi:thioredoxin:protein disulfide reductase